MKIQEDVLSKGQGGGGGEGRKKRRETKDIKG